MHVVGGVEQKDDKTIVNTASMITNINIKNYKSVVDVNLPLGRFNLLIGANGCGKSNILEGIALGAAASSDKLDYEYFANRGIRVVDYRMMLPAFEDMEGDDILVTVVDETNKPTQFDILYNKEAKPSRWENKKCFFVKIDNDFFSDVPIKEYSALSKYISLKLGDECPPLYNIHMSGDEIIVEPFNLELNNFIIYSLEESSLRKADDSNRTYPLGLHGEGLFPYLKALAQRDDGIAIFDEIKENLKILDWFDDMQVPSGQLSSEFNLKLKDSYLSETLNTFDQRSTNEGFLYLLFYLTLIISDETPQFFAIENIDTAFNPKLCREVTRRLIKLAKKHNKQIIATTHNAAVLDGMNLYEDDVRLHVVRRSIDGYTMTNRVVLKENMTMRLSEAWVKGIIGGLPDNF